MFVCREEQAAHQGRLLPAPGPGEGQLKRESSQKSALVVKLNQWYSFKVFSAAQLKYPEAEQE